MFNIRCTVQPHPKGAIADLTVTTTSTSVSELELGTFIQGLAEVAMGEPGVEAVWKVVDRTTGKISLAHPRPWEHLRQMIIKTMDPSTENFPFPLPAYLAGRIDALGHSHSHVYVEVSLNYQGLWTSTKPATTWIN
jgi:hypothetical protein